MKRNPELCHPPIVGFSFRLQQVAEVFQGWSPRSPFPVDELQTPTAGGAPASVPPAQGIQASELPSPKSRARRQLSGHNRVNGPHSRAREKEAGGSQTKGQGSEGPLLTTSPALLGEIDHPQQWPQLFSSALKETDLGSRYQRGPFLQGLLSGL